MCGFEFRNNKLQTHIDVALLVKRKKVFLQNDVLLCVIKKRFQVKLFACCNFAFLPRPARPWNVNFLTQYFLILIFHHPSRPVSLCLCANVCVCKFAWLSVYMSMYLCLLLRAFSLRDIRIRIGSRCLMSFREEFPHGVRYGVHISFTAEKISQAVFLRANEHFRVACYDTLQVGFLFHHTACVLFFKCLFDFLTSYAYMPHYQNTYTNEFLTRNKQT